MFAFYYFGFLTPLFCRFLLLLDGLYQTCPGIEINMQIMLKNSAIEALQSITEVHEITSLYNSFHGRIPANTDVDNISKCISKLLIDDVATLRRISRVPDSNGINTKLLLCAGRSIHFLYFEVV